MYASWSPFIVAPVRAHTAETNAFTGRLRVTVHFTATLLFWFRDTHYKMAHQVPPSVNCSLDDIDLTALKVSKGFRRRDAPYAAQTRADFPDVPSFPGHTGPSRHVRGPGCDEFSHMGAVGRQSGPFFSHALTGRCLFPGSGWYFRADRGCGERYLWTSLQGTSVTFIVSFVRYLLIHGMCVGNFHRIVPRYTPSHYR